MAAPSKFNFSFQTWRDFALLTVAFLVTPGERGPFWPVLAMLVALVVEPAGNRAEGLKARLIAGVIRLGSASLVGLVCAYLFTSSTLPLLAVNLVWLSLVAAASLVSSADRIAGEGNREAEPKRPLGLTLTRLGEGFHESTTLFIGLILSWRFWPGLWISWKMLAFTWFVFVATSFVLRRTNALLRVGIALSIAAAVFSGYLIISGTELTHAYFGPLSLNILFLYSQTCIRKLSPECRNNAESFRLAIVLAVTFFIYQPLAYTVLHGTGDALWYGTMLADMLEQVRHGVFPVWAGQSIYQFNGAIYPLRVAPAFHYVGAFFDAITFHSLNAIAVQNLMLLTWGLFAGLGSYLCAAQLLPGSRNFAVLAAVLFVACPGVMSVVYYTDLYMSWMTIPFLPIVLYFSVKSFTNTTRINTIGLGAALGFMWWGHSPMALWTTLIAVFTQTFRLLFLTRNIKCWFAMLPTAIAFVAVAIYPVTSVLLFPPEHGVNAAGFQQATAANIAFFVKTVFPAVVLPIKNTGLSLACFQLGYSLWVILLAMGVLIWKMQRPVARLYCCFALALALLLLPIPHLNETLWGFVPAFIRDTTGNWVMNRLYAILAGTTIFAGVLFFAESLPKFSATTKPPFTLGLILLCGWSLHEAEKFGDDAVRNLRPKESATESLLPENAIVTRFAYLVFPQLPAYFSHGVVDPELETRFFSNDGRLQWSNAQAVLDAWKNKDPRTEEVAVGRFVEEDASAANWSLSTELILEPHQHYLVVFDFSASRIPPGVMQLIGGGLFREYELPLSGSTKAFGSGPESAPYIPIWNTQSLAATVRVRFIAKAPDPSLDLSLLKLSLVRYERSVLPAAVTSWIPYSVQVSTNTEGWLETPRSFHRDFLNSLQGDHIKRSEQDLVMVKVGPGTSEITLRSSPPLAQQTLFWMSFLSILGSSTYVLYSLRMRPGSVVP